MIASLIGAAFALGAYLGNQRGWFDRNTITYNVLNLATGVVLTTVAAFDGRIGFIVLNVVWGIAAVPPRRACLAARRIQTG